MLTLHSADSLLVLCEAQAPYLVVVAAVRPSVLVSRELKLVVAVTHNPVVNCAQPTGSLPD